MVGLDILITAPVMAWQPIIDGLLIGAVFALAAYGLALVWGVMNIINVTQGEFVILGGYVAFTLYDKKLPIDLNAAGPAGIAVYMLLSILLATAVLYVIGWLLYRSVLYKIMDRDLFVSLLATYGISIVMQQLMNAIFGTDSESLPAFLGSWFLFDGLIAVSIVKVIAFILAVALGGILFVFLKYSRMGQAIRATSQNARAARVLGIDTDKVYATTYALNAAICGAAGALVGMAYTLHPYIGLPYTVRSFMIVIIAGLGNVGAVIGAALGLGASENMVGFIFGAEFQIAFVFGLLVVVLVFRNWRLGRKRQYLK